jgi:hypothetical protein
MAQKKFEFSDGVKKKQLESSAAGTPGGKSSGKKPMKQTYSTIIGLFIISLLFGGIFYIFKDDAAIIDVTISELVQSHKSGKYSAIEVRDQIVTATLKDSSISVAPPAPVSSFSLVPAPDLSKKEKAVLPLTDSLKDIGIDIDNPGDTKISVKDTTSLHFWADLAPTIV